MDSAAAMCEQLKELFPHIEESFLQELCDKYSPGDALDVGDLVETVMAQEFPPLKEGFENAYFTARNPPDPKMLSDPRYKMDSMTAMKDQLVEIFPDIKENFLKGLCEAYESESPDIAQMVENVLSFENPPLKENVQNKDDVDDLLGLTLDTNETVKMTQMNYVEQSSSDSGDSGIEVAKENRVPLFVDKVNEILVKASYDGRDNQIKIETAELDSDDDDEPLLHPVDMPKIEHKPMKEESSTESASDSDYEEGDSWEELEDQFVDEKPQQESINQTGSKKSEIEPCYVGQESESLDGFSDSTDIKPPEMAGDSYVSEPLSNVSDSIQAEVQGSEENYTCQPSTSSFGLEKLAEPKEENINHQRSGEKTQQIVFGYEGACNIKQEPDCKQECDSVEQELDAKNVLVSNFPTDTDRKFALLSKILPDADINYLLDQSKTLTDHETLLFMAKSLETRDYPKEKKEELKGPSFMDNFECKIEDFLREIPDPATEFSSQFYSRAGYKGNAEIYLKSRYPEKSMAEIREQLEAHGYNLTMVAETFDLQGSEVNPFCLENLVLHHDANIFFSQEVWYIENKKEIQDYLNSVLEAVKIEEELNRPPTPVPVDEVFECGICSEEIVEYLELGTCDGPQGHLFCKTCVRRSTEVKLAEGGTKFPCLHNCGGFIPLQTIEEVLPSHTYSILCDKIQEEEIRLANVAAVETCPFCPYAYGPGDEQYFTCNRPSCMKISCRTCLKEAHGDTICDMFKNEDEETARHIIENRMSDALIRYCYSCKKPIVKSSGCNKMTCNCGAKMCYICRQPVTDYTHFNGQGGDATDKCELFSQDENLHERPVAASAQAALNEIQANNPGLQLDANKLIPK